MDTRLPGTDLQRSLRADNAHVGYNQLQFPLGSRAVAVCAKGIGAPDERTLIERMGYIIREHRHGRLREFLRSGTVGRELSDYITDFWGYDASYHFKAL
jgi:hypothetical protein